jgi:L-ascorbate metabolism protein UlaG (beta-lactamase superfamily)
MRIRYLAHSSFLITTDEGTQVLLDPYEAGGYGGAMRYGQITDPADIAINSHNHADHGHTSGLAGAPTVLDGLTLAKNGPRTLKGVTLRALRVFHDPNGGRERGDNAMILLDADGLRLCHCGDLGHTLTDRQVQEIGAVDVLLIPVGGFFTIDAAQATQVMESLHPSITIPMHYKTERVDFPIQPVDGFVAGKQNVRRGMGSEVEVTHENLPAQPDPKALNDFLLNFWS